MKIIITKEELIAIINDICKDVVDNLLEEKINSLFDIDSIICPIVVDSKMKDMLDKKNVILEWEQYPKIPKTNYRYRYDKGKNIVGMEDHIHVFYGNTKNQLYAINRSGTPHDGSKAQLSNKEIKFLKSKGFNVPENGILEWIELDVNKDYYIYYPTPQILLD